MQDEKFDDEMVRQMLDWLSRGMDAEGNFSEPPAPAEMRLTQEDCYFLRQLRIAISLDEQAMRLAS